MSDKLGSSAYDTGGSEFDATRNADNPVSPEAEAAGHREADTAAQPASVAVQSTQSPSAAHPASASPATKISQVSWDRAVGEWINSHVRSSPITQGATGAWEHLNAALPKLKALLERELSSKT
jgi:hypothetical protein